MANAIVPQLNASSSSTTIQKRFDLIETRGMMAKTVLDILLIAMSEDSPPTENAIINTIWAVTELLSVPETVA